MFQTPAMTPILIGPEYFPGPEYQSDEDILEVIKNTLMTIYHASCTCKMGTRDDYMAVVDHRARVFGVTGLRVVDASAFPFLPPGHPQSVVCKYLSLFWRECFLTSVRYACREDRGRHHWVLMV
jgi:choline dehydrogenase